jgi:hypothetical protein
MIGEDSRRRYCGFQRTGTTHPFAMKQREEPDREAGKEDSAMQLRLTPLTLKSAICACGTLMRMGDIH